MARPEADLSRMNEENILKANSKIKEPVAAGSIAPKKFPLDIKPILATAVQSIAIVKDIPYRLHEAIPDSKGLKFSLSQGLQAISEQKKHFEEGKMPSEEFLEKNKEELENIVFGGSFSPEKMEEILREKDGAGLVKLNLKKEPHYYQNRSLEALKIIVEKFNIHDIRLGIRWENVDKDGTYDFNYYQDYLDYLLKSEYCKRHIVRVCLNVGPIKVFRWKEEHVPEHRLKKLTVIPDKRSKITSECELAAAGLEHLDKLLSYLTGKDENGNIVKEQKYTEEELSRIDAQANNEGFNPFGENEWIMSSEFEKNCLKKIHAYLPDAKLLVNSAGVLQMAKIRKLFNELINEDESFKGKLKMGINYYYALPPFSQLPIIRNIDGITVSKFFGKNLAAENIEASRKDGFDIEGTEAQGEEWEEAKTPGNSLYEFQGMVIRFKRTMLDQTKQSVIRYWGLEQKAKEYMYHELNDEHKGIIRVMSTVNNKGPVLA